MQTNASADGARATNIVINPDTAPSESPQSTAASSNPLPYISLDDIENQIRELKNSKRNIKYIFNFLEAVFVLVAVLNLAAAISFPFVDSSFLSIFENNPANIGIYSVLTILSIAAVIIFQIWKVHLIEEKNKEISNKYIQYDTHLEDLKKQSGVGSPKVIKNSTENHLLQHE